MSSDDRGEMMKKILYHYSVDSYKTGDSLLNDFKNQYRFAEPFILALEKSEDCFFGTLFAAMAYSRELCALGLRKHENYVKDSVEAIFEYVRRSEFMDNSVSRIGCVYYCETYEEAVSYLRADCIDNGDFNSEQVKLLEVEVDDDSIYRYDQYFFNKAQDIMSTERDLDKARALAREYFSMKRSNDSLIEVLSAGENRIIREIPIQM